jgi:hypothetical protein
MVDIKQICGYVWLTRVFFRMNSCHPVADKLLKIRIELTEEMTPNTLLAAHDATNFLIAVK